MNQLKTAIEYERGSKELYLYLKIEWMIVHT